MAPLRFATLVCAAIALVNATAVCPKGVHIFATPGHKATPGQLTNLYGPVHRILELIPGSTFLRTPFKHSPAGTLAEIDPGQTVLEDSIQEFVGKCPHVPFVLLGYSEGACITMDTLCGASSAVLVPTIPIDSKYTKNLIATIVMGDETRAINQPYNRGTCKSPGTITRLNPLGCDPYASRIRSYCDTPDPYCCLGGNNRSAHGSYPGLYDNVATAFVLDQYKEFRSHK